MPAIIFSIPLNRIFAVLSLCVTACLATCLPAAALAAEGAPAAPGALTSAVVALREVELSYPAEAVVEAVRQATLAAQVQGRISEVRVDAGARVKAGAVLMRIDAREAAESLRGAQAVLANAKAHLERTRSLQAQKFLSQAALDKAEADYKAAAAASGQAGALHGFATISAPFAGVVAQRHAELGEMAAPGKPLLTLFEPQGLRVLASIPQYKLAEIRQLQGGASSLRARVEFPASGKWLDGVSVELLPTVDANVHVLRARVYLPTDAALSSSAIPGMFARAHFIIGKAKKLLVPAAAVVRRGELTGVYVLNGLNPPQLRQVRLGEPVVGGDLEVLAGLAAGETVALEPLKAGMALKRGGK